MNLKEYLLRKLDPIEIEGLDQILKDRFNLDRSDPFSLRALHLNLLTTDLDSLLTESKAQSTSTTATDASDTYTVPAGKRWKVKLLTIDRQNAGTNEIYFSETALGPDVKVAEDVASIFTTVQTDIILDEGQSVTLAPGTGTSGVIITQIWYEEIIF
jgi:hypothetical protein